MKRTIKSIAIIAIASTMLTSCYNYTVTVGNGAKGNEKVSKWNDHFIEGIVQGKQVNHKELAAGAKDYDVNHKISFGNILISAVTFGIYTPTTVTVIK